MACNSYSRTGYYDKMYFIVAMPVIIVIYVAIIRGALWALGLILRAPGPYFKTHKFFGEVATEKRTAWCFDVRRLLRS